MKSKSSDTTKDSSSNDESLSCASHSNSVTSDSLSPQHIAIIMDGNNRWARKRFLPGIRGHKAGVEAIRSVLAVCEKHQV
ncbi:MAG: undecaprenyl diphosphate synthase family protein, partial [Pseudomonadales bacterium]